MSTRSSTPIPISNSAGVLTAVEVDPSMVVETADPAEDSEEPALETAPPVKLPTFKKIKYTRKQVINNSERSESESVSVAITKSKWVPIDGKSVFLLLTNFFLNNKTNKYFF